MLRPAVLAVAQRRWVRRVATGGLGRRVALRFVAGEEVDDAIAATKAVNATGATVSIDYLGEHCDDPATARAAAEIYRAVLERIESAGLDANLSVKLTQMGLDIDSQVAMGNAALVVLRAAEAGTSVTLDMEDHSYTDRTLDACLRLAHRYPGRIGLALQAYLRRSAEDLERLVREKVHVRLCKGAYREPPSIAYQRVRDVDAAFARLARRLIESDAYPMIATHDERLIGFARRCAERAGRARDHYEFQMLYGVRRELQRRLVADGYRLRVYVPFGREWYPYLVRRIAERPANVRFFLEALVRG